jgi:hypothetical protein
LEYFFFVSAFPFSYYSGCTALSKVLIGEKLGLTTSDMPNVCLLLLVVAGVMGENPAQTAEALWHLVAYLGSPGRRTPIAR